MRTRFAALLALTTMAWMAWFAVAAGVAHADTIAPTVTSSAVLTEAPGTRSFTALTTATNDYLVVEAVLEGDNSTSLTASGGALTYTKQIDTGLEATNQHLRHYVWTAPDTAGGTRTVRLTASGSHMYMARASVVHGSSGVGVHVADRTAQAVSATRQGDHSMVFMSGGDWSTNPVGTPVWTPGGTTLTAVQGGQATYVFGRWDDSGPAATASHGIASGVAWTRPGMAVLEMKGVPAADTTPPSTPGNLHVTATTTSSVSLAWDASTDNVGVTGYNVYRNGTQVATPAGTSFTDTGLAAGTTYSYTVAAHDAAGNTSPASSSVDATTQSESAQCAPYPAFPDASCTGPTGVMPNYSGPMNITTDGAVIENVVINTTGITVSANNVTFRNCKIVYSGTGRDDYGLVEANTVTGTVFDHCEIDGKDQVKDAIHGGDNFTVTNCNIHDVGNGVEAGSAFTVKESYIWNIYTPTGYDWHADGIQAWDGASNMLVDHNTVLLPFSDFATGAVDFVGTTAQHDNLVQHNLMAGAGYTVYVGSSTSNTNVRVINNHWSTRYFPKVGYYNIYYPDVAAGVTVSGNVIDETGAPADSNL